MDTTIHTIAARYGVRIVHVLPPKRTPLGEGPYFDQVQLMDTPDGRVIFVMDDDWLEHIELVLHELAHSILGWDARGDQAEVQERNCYFLEREWAGELTDSTLRIRALEDIDRMEREVLDFYGR